MPNASRPAGPGRPRVERRDLVREGEQILETLNPARGQVKRTGSAASRVRPSPQVGNDPVPGGPPGEEEGDGTT
ncbi:hypothetical protein IS481_16820 [Caldimonas thermodepolymerans]|jgi:hypothetical protein|uniref:Uncharacterized protein n=1 Tax=Caldimonas thermodepolymerans TaxID=215580 RepID=A0A2S5T7W3_9BURK|nr:hypothetical protein [Caldimonas thermodepolymerans]PPE71059.1 hypothetical protein C1702_03595 [Caldimonas thermodepolymerans]QPC31361.1 hypothetical protein IS481_16820 [Caldimonas thermodepolymerans]RDH99673.1 hypothetical protein DES46_105155 [Caldimonas thermodepolymerans]TCP07601.1 hypothetical protein EV676_104156 [Caldimonas thermodepolymerans]UZG44105.1 hypothetical protein ONZ46_17245 [Caldimonas thermodepolymerans]